MELKDVNRILRKIELEEFEKATLKAFENGVNLKLLDLTMLSLSPCILLMIIIGGRVVLNL